MSHQETNDNAGIKVSIYSDIHTEFGNKFPEVPYDTEVIILAGDDVVGDGKGLLQDFCNINYDKQIVMVAGNHNYYGQDFHSVNKAYKDMVSFAPNLHFLNNETFEYKGIVFHGCTLWTDFSCKGEVYKEIGMLEAGRCISDFRSISYNGGKITPKIVSELHKESKEWLSRSLLESNSVNVVVTHFPPLLECKHPKIPEGILDTYFNNDLSGLVNDNCISYWVYGHNHWSDDFPLYDTRFISNQCGYPRETTNYRSNNQNIFEYSNYFTIKGSEYDKYVV
jgi:predicted phosphohydrolase